MKNSLLSPQTSAFPNLPKLRAIEYYYGGPQAETLAASYKIMRRAAAELKGGEHVLYLNTLTSAREVEAVADSIAARHHAKVLTITLASAQLAARMQFITHTVAAKKVRVIVLNSLDFAARTSNQRKALVHWLREMRDMHDCRVVVYGIHAPSVDGAMAQLKYICERSISHQDWDRKVMELPGMLNPDLPAKHPSLVASEAITELERELPVIEEEVSENSELFVDDPSVISPSRHLDLSTMPLNKINDLAGAWSPQGGEIKNEELRIKDFSTESFRPKQSTITRSGMGLCGVEKSGVGTHEVLVD
ncbi:MAG TPA: hypothetical protein VFH43_08700 [Candidatus Kapabacteria bacterium]|nr:hypothetical protein [Candidatus Kapabacteria bacterium]